MRESQRRDGLFEIIAETQPGSIKPKADVPLSVNTLDANWRALEDRDARLQSGRPGISVWDMKTSGSITDSLGLHHQSVENLLESPLEFGTLEQRILATVDDWISPKSTEKRVEPLKSYFFTAKFPVALNADHALAANIFVRVWRQLVGHSPGGVLRDVEPCLRLFGGQQEKCPYLDTEFIEGFSKGQSAFKDAIRNNVAEDMRREARIFRI